MSKGYPLWRGVYTLTQSGSTRRRRLFGHENVPLYEFRNSGENPLTLHLGSDRWVAPFRHFDKFDFGTVPLILQGLVSPLSSARAFILHDSCYEFHAWWGPGPDGRSPTVIPISRNEADEMLRLAMLADGCSAWQARKAWLAVRLGGAGAWRANSITAENLRRRKTADEWAREAGFVA